MSEETNNTFAEADEAIEAGERLVRGQEARVARMRAAGMKVGEAEALLEAYRYAVRLAIESRDALIAQRGPEGHGQFQRSGKADPE